MPTGTDTASELTREQVQAILIEPLAQASVFLAAGPRIFDTNGSSVRIPKLTGMDAPSWTGENELIGEVDPTFDEIELLPSTMKSVKSITRYSNEMARQSVVSLDAALRARMVRDTAAKLDTAFIASTVTDGTEPLGLLSYADRQTITAVGDLDLDVLLDAWGMALGANVNMASLRWMIRPESFTELRKIKDTQDRYQLQPDPTADGVFRLFGAPVTVTARIPATTGATPTTSLVLADFSQIAVARDLAPSVKILSERYADYDQQAIRVVARYDAKPMQPEAVVTVEGVNVPA